MERITYYNPPPTPTELVLEPLGVTLAFFLPMLGLLLWAYRRTLRRVNTVTRGRAFGIRPRFPWKGLLIAWVVSIAMGLLAAWDSATNDLVIAVALKADKITITYTKSPPLVMNRQDLLTIREYQWRSGRTSRTGLEFVTFSGATSRSGKLLTPVRDEIAAWSGLPLIKDARNARQWGAKK